MRISERLRRAASEIKTIDLEPYLYLFDGLKEKGWRIKMKSRGQITALFEQQGGMPSIITLSVTIANQDSVDYRGMAQLDATWPEKWNVKNLKNEVVQEPYSSGMVKLEPELFGFWPQDRERFLASAKLILKRFENATPQET
jgi:hypothetical protein